MNEVECGSKGRKRDLTERQKLIAWRIDWLIDEITVAWSEHGERLERLIEERWYWEEERDNPNGTRTPNLDAKGRPFGLR